MSFANEILNYKSVSIVGLEKNTGKTECLNYILNNIEATGKTIAITSIGVDGETVDNVTGTHKPDVFINPDTIFVTAEKCLNTCSIKAEILGLSNRTTALGRLVTARALMPGKVLLSGPPDTAWLLETLKDLAQRGVDTTIVDGALFRRSHGSPLVTEAIVLSTGASVSNNINELIHHTRYVHQLIHLPQALLNPGLLNKLFALTAGVYSITGTLEVKQQQLQSVFTLPQLEEDLFAESDVLYFPGALTGRMLDHIRIQRRNKPVRVLIKDFTRVFADRRSLYSFINAGHELMVLLATKLIAVCVNPVAPNGFQYDPTELRDRLSEALKIPVYDIKQESIYAPVI